MRVGVIHFHFIEWFNYTSIVTSPTCILLLQKLLFYSNSWVMTFLWSQALHHHISYSIFIWHVTEIKFIKHKRVMTLSNNNHVVRIEKHKKWGFRGFGCLLFKSCTHHLHYSHMIMLLCDASKKTNDFFLLYNLHIALTHYLQL